VAQAPPSPHTPAPPTATRPVPQDCDGAPLKPEPRTGETSGTAPPTLSEKLAKGEGVLCPPKKVDPEILAPTPDVGTMPVIPPPGSPGGDPTLQPR